MRIVLALFFFGTANSASLFTSHLADAEIEYRYRNDRLTGVNIEYEQGSFVQPEPVPQNIVSDTSAAQTFYTVDDGMLEKVEPTHFTYSVGFGDPKPTAQIVPASVPVVQTYASETAPGQPVGSLGMTYYKVDDSQLEQVNPTHVSYSHNAPSPAISVQSYAAPAASVSASDSLSMTYYNVDDGQLEQVNPTHISYTSPSDTVAVETYAAPAAPAVQMYSAPVVETMDTTYYNVDDGKLEQVNPTHVSYSHNAPSPAISVQTYAAPAASVPATDSLSMTYYNVDDGQLEQVNPTHISYTSPSDAVAVKTYAAPADPSPAVEIMDATYYNIDDGQLEQVNPTHVSYSASNLAPAAETYSVPAASVPAADPFDKTYYKVDDGQLEQVNPTHVSYSAHDPVPAVVANAAASSVSIPATEPLDTTYYKVDDGQLEQVRPTHVTYSEPTFASVSKTTAPVARARTSSRGRVQQTLSTAPSTQYMPVETILGNTVTLTQEPAPLTQEIYTSDAQAVKEKATVVPSMRNAGPEPYLLSGPVAEYAIPYGVDIPGVDFTSDGLSQPASAPMESNFSPEVVSYSIIPTADPVIENYYKVDDGQLEQVNPTHVSYDAPNPIPAPRTTSRGRVQNKLASAPVVETYSAPFSSFTVDNLPATSVSETFYKVDDGKLEQVNPTHVSYNAEVSVSVNEPTPSVEKYSVPALLSVPEAAPSVSLLESFYKVDDGQLEQVTPTHVSYSSHMSIPVHVPAPEPVVTTYTAPAIGQVAIPAHVPAAPVVETFYTVDDNQLEQVNPTHISYSTHTSAPASVTNSAEPHVLSPVPEVPIKFDTNPNLAITNMLQTFYKQDDGKLEEVIPTHVSYSNYDSVANPLPDHIVEAAVEIAAPSPWWTPDVKTVNIAPAPIIKAVTQAPLWNTAPVVQEAPPAPVSTVKAAAANPWWTPEPVVENTQTVDAGIKHDNSVVTITNMLQTFYKQDDGELEKVSPTHISYNTPDTLEVASVPAVKKYSVPELLSVATPAPITAAKIATPSPWWTPEVKAATPATLTVIKKATSSPWWTPDVKAATPAPVSAVKKVTPSPWWNPEDLDKKDEPSVDTSIPIIKSMEKSSTKDTDKAVEIEVAEVKQAVDEQSYTKEEEVEANPAETKTTEEAEKDTVGSEDTEGSERAEGSEGSEGEEGSERSEGAEGSEGAEEEEGANTKSEGEENNEDEAEDEEEEEVSKYTATSGEEDSDEK